MRFCEKNCTNSWKDKKSKKWWKFILEPLFHKKERAPFINEFVILHSFLCVKVIILYKELRQNITRKYIFLKFFSFFLIFLAFYYPKQKVEVQYIGGSYSSTMPKIFMYPFPSSMKAATSLASSNERGTISSFSQSYSIDVQYLWRKYSPFTLRNSDISLSQ